MKISQSLRDNYAELVKKYDHLKERVGRTIPNLILIRNERWNYEGRVKELESFALKVETGRYKNPAEIDDLFACTIIVDKLDSMQKAESMVRHAFTFKERRPPKAAITSKTSDSFRFDDTRLYVKWKDDPTLPPTGLKGTLFEVQVKTLLAHAWSIATHDLTYKTDEKSWPKERIAYQIKAMLENAEISIYEANKLAKSASLKKTDNLSSQISTIIDLLNELWPPIALPSDKKRLAENINNLISNVGIDLELLHAILLEETRLGRGANTLNLSPYAIVIQSLFNQQLTKMKRYLTGRNRSFKVFIPSELELPPSLDPATLKNAIRAPSA